MTFYSKIFFCLYRYFSGIGRSNDTVFMAVTYLCVWDMMWFFNIVILTDLLGYKIDLGPDKAFAFGITLILYLKNYFLFWYNDKYEQIDKKFQKSYSGVLNPWIATFMVILPLLTLSVLIYLNMVKLYRL